MKKILSLFLAVIFSASLCACTAATKANSGPAAQDGVPTAYLTGDAGYAFTTPEGGASLDGGGAAIAVALDVAGTEDNGKNAALWSGVCTFCQNFNYTSKSFAAAEETEQAEEDTLRQAAESGAGLVICVGSAMEMALYTIQDNYPSVSFLILDGEPHDGEYASYRTGNNTHCVLFREEQAGYLAGYAAVAEGYTNIGFLGAQTMPPIVRYGTGYLQGAEAAAEDYGVQIAAKYWYSGVYEANDDITTRMSGWYADGCQVIFAAGGNLAQSCIDACAQQTNASYVIAAGYDQTSLDAHVLATAQKCYSRIVQEELYAFYSGGSVWASDKAALTETVGCTLGGVALSGTEWRFSNFTQEAYTTLYEKLFNAQIKVERFSDTNTTPDTPNLTVDFQN
jgi:basic membrane protein A